MSIGEDLNNSGFEENEFEEKIGVSSPIPDDIQEEKSGFSFDFGWLKTPTGEGSIEERIDHPLNFFKSKGMAQIIRGLEGFAGNLKLAIVDVALGILSFVKERKNVG